MTTGVRGESVEAYHLMARTPHTVYRTGPERSGGSELRLSSRKGNRQVVTKAAPPVRQLGVDGRQGLLRAAARAARKSACGRKVVSLCEDCATLA